MDYIVQGSSYCYKFIESILLSHVSLTNTCNISLQIKICWHKFFDFFNWLKACFQHPAVGGLSLELILEILQTVEYISYGNYILATAYGDSHKLLLARAAALHGVIYCIKLIPKHYFI